MSRKLRKMPRKVPPAYPFQTIVERDTCTANLNLSAFELYLRYRKVVVLFPK